MTTKIEKSVIVNVPVATAYNQWTQFEDFPHFMGGVSKVTQLSDDRLRWVAEIAGVKREWEARIVEQVPDEKVAWAATEGATNAGAVRFEDLGGGQARLHLTLEYEPEGLVEKVGDHLNLVEKQAVGDLERFKQLIESEGYASGAWRGTIAGAAGTPGVGDAAQTRGDSGKAGLSARAVVAGAAVAGAAVAGAMAARKGDDDQDTDTPVPDVTVEPVHTVDVVEPPLTSGVAPVTPTPGTVATGDPLVDPVDRVDSTEADGETRV